MYRTPTKHRVSLRRETIKVIAAASLVTVGGGVFHNETNLQTLCPNDGQSEAACSIVMTSLGCGLLLE